MAYVGASLPHENAALHVSGRSQFIDDLPPRPGELQLALVVSPVARGRLRGVDAAAALAMPGVAAVLTAADIPGARRYGPIAHDEAFLAEDDLVCVGQPVALVAAETRAQALAARAAVKLDVEELPAILDIDAAVAAGSFMGDTRRIVSGDPVGAMAAAERRLEGCFRIGGQEHFYLESQAAIAWIDELDTVKILSSTQHPTETQALAAEILGINRSQVTVECRRMGGGFGGKETQAGPPAALAALAARRLGRPARLVLDRDSDMATTGKRHPFRADWKVGFGPDGRLRAVDVKLWADGGCTLDLSPSILERALLHLDNAYHIPNLRFEGTICRTNLPSNTAFRGFGGPQGVAAIENIVDEVAAALGLDALAVRRRNLYGGAPDCPLRLPYGQELRNNVLPRLVDKLRAAADYDRRRAEIEAHNAAAPAVRRGLALTTVKFGISFTTKTFNQANALVNLYADGSVLVSTGATEMGQGVYTRLRQLVADEFGLDFDRVRVAATSTDRNANTSATAASSGSDLNGAAALDACGKIKLRLGAFAAGLLCGRPVDGETANGLSAVAMGAAYGGPGIPAAPGLDPVAAAWADDLVWRDGEVWSAQDPGRRLAFPELVAKAYRERVNLGERGFYVIPNIVFDRDAGRGTPFFYFTNGAAVSEVALDRRTGELRVERVDILMDAGAPINPGIDRGQIVGGFVQGMGWVTTEELRWSAKGELLSHSPTTYKIPGAGDLPRSFSVEFLDNPDNAISLKRSKALGEPPLLLGLSVFYAAKDALRGLRAPGGDCRLGIPASGEALLMEIERLAGRAGRAD